MTGEIDESPEMPAVRVMLKRLGYEIVSVIDIRIVDGPFRSFNSPVLLARSRKNEKSRIALLFGDIAWSTCGEGAFIDFRMYVVSGAVPETLQYSSVEEQHLHWAWRAPCDYVAVKEDSVRWMKSQLIGFR